MRPGGDALIRADRRRHAHTQARTRTHKNRERERERERQTDKRTCEANWRLSRLCEAPTQFLNPVALKYFTANVCLL